ncbi:hypothetical protein SAMN04487977_102620 [Treponema bryantii]|uniref:Uncharacterized protein n=1 Tax=Treponema bryantii TaxID=163 RepID=A0A1H9DNH7_9SPIR|nr:hypothetical protein [Treponema bryantii]SEQ14303.1 hypothetical protein SAMN04487977_102620 [Treponema bryantii]
MTNLLDGVLLINDIEISINDSLTDVLAKTIKIPKVIRNINNYQHLFINDILLFEKEGNIKMIFSSNGILEFISFGISKGCEVKDREELLLFLKKHNIILTNKNGLYEKQFRWGILGVENDIHNPGHFSLCISKWLINRN